jgi:hypothetical protein
MTRVLRRPMFRMGGNTDQGIMSGVVPRQGYDVGGEAQKIEKILKRGAGVRPDRSLSNFLIDFGLNVAGATPGGSIFSTAARAAQEPFGTYQKSKADRAAIDQQIGLSAATMALEHEQAQKLKMMGDKTSMGTLRKNARDIVNSGIINPATNEPYTDSEAFQYAIELAETSPGKPIQMQWQDAYDKTDIYKTAQQRRNETDFNIKILPNIKGIVVKDLPLLPQTGKNQPIYSDIDAMDPNTLYWDEAAGELKEVVMDENGVKKEQIVEGWRKKYHYDFMQR